MTNTSHRQRLARTLAVASGLPYQEALRRVRAAADAALLPDTLDADGTGAALTILLHVLPPFAGQTSATRPTAAAVGHRRLADLLGDVKLAAGVAARVQRAQAADPVPVRQHGRLDPYDLGWIQDAPDQAALTADPDMDWMQLVLIAGVRGDFEFVPPYPPHSGELSLDMALDQRDATGDVDRYERGLKAIVKAEPRDVDAWVHLGNLAWNEAGLGDDWAPVPGPGPAEQRRHLRRALGFYQSAVAIAELSIPDGFDGFLRWGLLDNRPYLRGLHGLATALWRLEHHESATRVVISMLQLSPDDNQGARMLLPYLRSGQSWDSFAE